MCSVVSVPRGDAVLGCLRDLENESRAGGKPPADLPACTGSSAAGMPDWPSSHWGCTSPRGYLIRVLRFEAAGGFTGLWGPHRVGGAALQPVVLQRCPSVVLAPVTATELSWVAGTLLWEQGIRRSFPTL